MIGFERSSPAPHSLRAEDTYDTPEVRDRLFNDARGKCYLCERPVERGNFEIDHRKPKAENQFPELRKDWRNLYCCCHSCNLIRPRLWPEQGLLSPDVAADDVEGRIQQTIGDDRYPCFEATSERDAPAVNTALELARVHGGEDKLRADDLRAALMLQLDEIHRNLLAWPRLQGPIPPDVRRNLRRLLSRKAPFTALVRSRFLAFPALVALFD